MINKTLRKKLLKDWYQFFSGFYFLSMNIQKIV